MVEGSSAPGSGYLTPERIMMRDTDRKFTAEEVTPLANKLDSEHGDIPRELILKMGELGFHGILIPEEYGGVGVGAFEYCLGARKLSPGRAGGAPLPSAQQPVLSPGPRAGPAGRTTENAAAG